MNYFHEKIPDIGQKFVAVCDDGACAELFQRVQDVGKSIVFVDTQGDIEHCIEDRGFFCWFPLPDRFMLWFEGREE